MPDIESATLVVFVSTHIVAWMSSLRRYESEGSVCCRLRYSATCRAGNSVSHTVLKSRAKWMASPAIRGTTASVKQASKKASKKAEGTHEQLEASGPTVLTAHGA